MLGLLATLLLAGSPEAKGLTADLLVTNFAGHLGQHEAESLLLGEDTTEGLPLGDIGRRLLQRGAGDPHTRGRDRDPALGQRGEGDLVALPSPPSRFATGTKQPSKTSSAAGHDRMPIFFSCAPKRNPSLPFSTRNAVMPFAPSAGSSVAKTR